MKKKKEQAEKGDLIHSYDSFSQTQESIHFLTSVHSEVDQDHLTDNTERGTSMKRTQRRRTLQEENTEVKNTRVEY